MLFLADQTFLTCIKGWELGPVRDLAIAGFKLTIILGSTPEKEQRTARACFFKTGFGVRGFWANRLDFDWELEGLGSKLLSGVLHIWKCWEVGGWFLAPIN
jgi:hypothetical protein